MSEEKSINEDVKALRKALNKNKKFSEGTVVRFKSSNAEKYDRGWSDVAYYSYAALYVAGRWWLTGVAGYFGKNVFTTEEFVEKVLSKNTTFDIEVATEFEGI